MTNSAGPEFVLSGYRKSTSMYPQDTGGYYWSSTAYSSATNAYLLGLYSSGSVYPAGGGTKAYGISLRCLARDKKSGAVTFFFSRRLHPHHLPTTH